MTADTEASAPSFSQQRILRGGALVAMGLFAAQATGFLRQAVIGYLLGTGAAADALSVAMAPVELWWSVLFLAVIFGFAPMLSPTGALGGYAFRQILKPVTQLGVVSAVVFIVFAEPLAVLFAPGLDAESIDLATGLLRVFALTTIAVGPSFAYSALLISMRKFAWASMHHAWVNLATIAGALLLYQRMGAYGFAVGYLTGSVLQLAGSWWLSRKLVPEQHRATRLRNKEVDLVTLLRGPAPILAQATAMELMTVVSRAYASTFGVGMTAALEYGFKLFRAPLAVIVVPLSQSLLPEISSLTDSAEDRRTAVRAIQRAAWLTLAGSFAVMVGMMLLRRPIVALLFERGEFTAESTEAVSQVLFGYMPVILGRGIAEMLSRMLFSTGVYRGPVLATFAALAINAAICSLLPSTHPEWIGIGAGVGFLFAALWIVRDVRALGRRS